MARDELVIKAPHMITQLINIARLPEKQSQLIGQVVKVRGGSEDEARVFLANCQKDLEAIRSGRTVDFAKRAELKKLEQMLKNPAGTGKPASKTQSDASPRKSQRADTSLGGSGLAGGTNPLLLDSAPRVPVTPEVVRLYSSRETPLARPFAQSKAGSQVFRLQSSESNITIPLGNAYVSVRRVNSGAGSRMTASVIAPRAGDPGVGVRFYEANQWQEIALNALQYQNLLSEFSSHEGSISYAAIPDPEPLIRTAHSSGEKAWIVLARPIQANALQPDSLTWINHLETEESVQPVIADEQSSDTAASANAGEEFGGESVEETLLDAPPIVSSPPVVANAAESQPPQSQPMADMAAPTSFTVKQVRPFLTQASYQLADDFIRFDKGTVSDRRLLNSVRAWDASLKKRALLIGLKPLTDFELAQKMATEIRLRDRLYGTLNVHYQGEMDPETFQKTVQFLADLKLPEGLKERARCAQIQLLRGQKKTTRSRVPSKKASPGKRSRSRRSEGASVMASNRRVTARLRSRSSFQGLGLGR